MGAHLLNDWSRIWTQDIGDEMAITMWKQLKQLIIDSRNAEDPMEERTEEDVSKDKK